MKVKKGYVVPIYTKITPHIDAVHDLRFITSIRDRSEFVVDDIAI